MKVLVLFDVARKTSPHEVFSARALKEEDKQTEADVLAALRRLGHEVGTLPVYDNVLSIIETLNSFRPDIVFNLSESFHHDRSHEPNIPALLELLKTRYTGAGPDALLLCKDKALSKKVLAYHRVRVPHFVISHLAHPRRRLRRFTYPGFVKPIGEEASDGISKASFVKDEGEALDRVRFIHEKFRTDALIEEYIEGRELYLSLIGHHRPAVLPTREIFFEEMPADAPKFATFKAKWDNAYRMRWGIANGPADELPPGIEAKLAKTARTAYRALKIRGFGRIDVRLTPEGEAVVIEANPNPCLGRQEDFAQAALQADIEYDALIQKVLDAAFM